MADVLTLLSAVTANTTGATADAGGVRDEAAVQVTTTGTVSAFSVQFQSSLDGTHWLNIGSAVTAVTGLTTVSGVLARYFRAVLSGYSGTGTVTAKIAVARS